MKCGIMFKKKNKRWIWIAICRSSKRIVGFVIGSRGKKTAKKLWQQIKHITCKQYCTDYWQAYESFVAADKHTVSKKETYTIESYNNLIRHYLARFNRRTHCYSKSEQLLSCLLTLFFHKLNSKYT